jgi:hypothetical protein
MFTDPALALMSAHAPTRTAVRSALPGAPVQADPRSRSRRGPTVRTASSARSDAGRRVRQLWSHSRLLPASKS